MKHYLGACLVLVTVAVIGIVTIQFLSNSVDRTIDHVRDAFMEVFNVKPQIMVNERIVLGQTESIAELAVVDKEEQVTVGLDEHLEVLAVQVPLTEKSLTASGVFQAKAGFNLRKSFQVDINPDTNELHCSMPHAEILSVEQIGALTFHGNDALFNKITDEERSQIVDSLTQAARDAADKSDLKAQAEKQVGDRLREILAHNGQPLALEWR